MKKKVAIITGAGGGMGLEITKAVAKEGYRVIMAGSNSEKNRPQSQKYLPLRY